MALKKFQPFYVKGFPPLVKNARFRSLIFINELNMIRDFSFLLTKRRRKMKFQGSKDSKEL